MKKSADRTMLLASESESGNSDEEVRKGYTVFKTCPKCGHVWKSHKYSKSILCKHCAILASLERVRQKKGKRMICPYCGEVFVSIHEAKHCPSQECKYKHSLTLTIQKGAVRKCLECGNKFTPKDKEQKFCCVSCAGKYRNRLHKPTGPIKYSDEQLIAVARSYRYKKDFRLSEPKLYRAAKRRGLLARLTLKSAEDIFGKRHHVYRYLFEEFNAVYIGRTLDPHKRDVSHRTHRTKPSAVLSFALEKGIEIPPMQILMSRLGASESQAEEDRFVQEYLKRGYKVLNVAKTGIGIGSIGWGGHRHYSKKKFLEIAQTVRSYSMLKQQYHSLWLAAQRNGWLKECSFIEYDRRPPRICTQEYCMKVAATYTSRKRLSDEDPTVYGVMLRNGWLDTCPNLKPLRMIGLTEEHCKSVAKKYSCSTELRRHNNPVWKKMQRKGWLKDCYWFKSHQKSVSLRKKVKCFAQDGQLLSEY